MRRIENRWGLWLGLAAAVFFIGACAEDSGGTTDGDDEAATDGDSDGEDSPACPNGFVYDEDAGRCLPDVPECPPGFTWRDGGCRPGDPSCPPGFEWSADLGRCMPQADGDADDDRDDEPAAEEEPTGPTPCRSNWDCPSSRECGEDGFCSEWSSGDVQGTAETLVFNSRPNDYKSPGKVWGRYRGEGIRIGYGAEAWLHDDPDFGEAVSIAVMDILSDDLFNLFVLTIRRDLVVEGATATYDAAAMKGYFIRASVDPDSYRIREETYLGQALAGAVRFGYVNLVHHGLLNADFAFYLGPVIDDPSAEND